jgi:hypothetical protein
MKPTSHIHSDQQPALLFRNLRECSGSDLRVFGEVEEEEVLDDIIEYHTCRKATRRVDVYTSNNFVCLIIPLLAHHITL